MKKVLGYIAGGMLICFVVVSCQNNHRPLSSAPTSITATTTALQPGETPLVAAEVAQAAQIAPKVCDLIAGGDTPDSIISHINATSGAPDSPSFDAEVMYDSFTC